MSRLRLGALLLLPSLVYACSQKDSQNDSQPSTTIDANGDLVADDLGTAYDPNGDGVIDWVDVNGDGTLDGPGVDTNGDGQADAIGIDTNGDGIIDALDFDGDGVIDQMTNNGGTGGVAGVGGTTTGTGATTATGATTGTGGAVNECVPVTNRCDCVVHADGVANVIDAFEDGDMRINVIDGRDGEWFQATARGTGAPLGSMAVESNALHMWGGATTLNPPQGQPDDWATFGVPLGQCYDATPYSGIKFRIKGTAGKTVIFSISTPPTTEVAAGGSCPDGDTGCYAHFRSEMILTADWQEKVFTWAELQQPAWGIKAPNGYDKAANILAINFAPMLNTEGYDFTVDDLEFTTEGGADCTSVIDSGTFNTLFPKRNAFYTYDGFAQAAAAFPGFCGSGTPEDRKRDAAALFAHTIQETGADVNDPTTGLWHITEIAQGQYCQSTNTQYPCAAGQSYFGRGPLQITWNYNYGQAGEALGLPLLANPSLVSSDPAIAFKAAIWFWMSRQPLESPHSAIVTGQGFAKTIEMVNGALECNGQQPQKTANRVKAFQHFCSLLGVDPGTNLDCN
jgi:hypothetical protein